MILDFNGQATVSPLHWETFRHRPGLKHALHLQAEVVVQPSGGVLLDHEREMLFARRANLALRLGCLSEIAFGFVFPEAHQISFPYSSASSILAIRICFEPTID